MTAGPLIVRLSSSLATNRASRSCSAVSLLPFIRHSNRFSGSILVGLADEQLSALGFLSRRLLQQVGVYEAVVRNRRATTPTADLLVAQLVTVDKLDAVIVYEANCNFVGDEAEIVRIDHPSAYAIQPFAVHQDTKFPALTARLLEFVSSARSRERFEKTGFDWQASEAVQ